MSSIALSASPLQAELDAGHEELGRLRLVLAERELEVLDLRGRLRAFESRYLAQIGTLYAELDELEARVAEHEVKLYKTDAARERAAAARRRAQQTYAAAHDDDAPLEAPEPTVALKVLFREVARRIHPDFARDPVDAAHRTRLMTQANEAYARGDADVLERLLDDHLEVNAAKLQVGAAAELEVVHRQIAHAQRDIAALDVQIVELPTGEIAQLKANADAVRATGRDLLAELAVTLRERIADAQHRLRFVERQVHAFDR